MNNKRKKVFIIVAVITIAIILIGMIIHSHGERVEYYNNSYGYTQHQQEGQSLGETVVNSAIKGAVSGYVAGKVMNHYANKNRVNYNTSSYRQHYDNNRSFNKSHYSGHHHRYR